MLRLDSKGARLTMISLVLDLSIRILTMCYVYKRLGSKLAKKLSFGSVGETN
jgi:hypothetical protein